MAFTLQRLTMTGAVKANDLGSLDSNQDNTRHDLTDVTVHSPRTQMRGVKATNVEWRPWIAAFPVCPALNQYHIAHVGIAEAVAPTQIVRAKQTTTYFLACFGGRGDVLIDGRWRSCRAGLACLLPAHTLNAFHALPGVRWKFCWVCYQQPAAQRPIADVASPVMARFEALPLHSAIVGLMHECHSATQPIVTQHWVELIHAYVLRFAQSMETTDPLRLLWERVAAHLAENWTLARLTHESGYSREHLRRLCQHQLGRGPMHQVIYLRMQRATELLATTPKTIDAIAHEVGYQNPFVFSNAFTKWIGWRPSEYRCKRAKTQVNGAPFCNGADQVRCETERNGLVLPFPTAASHGVRIGSMNDHSP